jgi:nitronate monooxygenase
MSDWHRTPAARALGVPYPSPGAVRRGQSSSVLTAAVSNVVGLGSYGARSLNPKEIREVVADIRRRTSSPFAVNLRLSTEDHGGWEITREQFETALAPLLPLYRGPLGYLNAPPAFGKT